jgi:hypothetical protein
MLMLVGLVALRDGERRLHGCTLPGCDHKRGEREALVPFAAMSMLIPRVSRLSYESVFR